MEHVDPLFGVILPYVNFVIFAILAVYFFRKPAQAAAQKKNQDYLKLVADSQRVREAAEQRLAELKGRFGKLDQEIADLKNLAREAAEQEAAKIVADAKRLAEHLQLEAQRVAAAEVENARMRLRQEVVDAVRDGVTSRLKQELDAKAQQRIVQTRINDLQALRIDA